MIEPIIPDWPAPAGVRALVTTRAGGVSRGPWAGLNLATHVGDSPDDVTENRRRLLALLPTGPRWLAQAHGAEVVEADRAGDNLHSADASFTRSRGVVCAIQVADCMPVLFAADDGSVVGAAHAGWRGLRKGVLEATVKAMGVPGHRLIAWIGPAIGPRAYEVGADVREAFVADDATTATAFAVSRPGHWWFDLCDVARRRLAAAGVRRVAGGNSCTHSDRARFFSFRRDGVTGRIAAVIWIDTAASIHL